MQNKVISTISFVIIWLFTILLIMFYLFLFHSFILLARLNCFWERWKEFFLLQSMFFSYHTDIICSSVRWGTSFSAMLKGRLVGMGVQKNSGGIMRGEMDHGWCRVNVTYNIAQGLVSPDIKNSIIVTLVLR